MIAVYELDFPRLTHFLIRGTEISPAFPLAFMRVFATACFGKAVTMFTKKGAT